MSTIAIFGGSAPQPNTPAYEEARLLGARLAQAGHVVMTGGYFGVMEAASRGAAEAGGHTIGVTTNRIAHAKGIHVNAWVKEEITYPNLRDRLYHLVSRCDAALALAGGIGTLSEIAFLWSLMQIGELPPKPLIAIGPVWAATLQTFLLTADAYLKPRDVALLQVAATGEEAVEMLTAVISEQ